MTITKTSVVRLEYVARIEGKTTDRSLEGEPQSVLLGHTPNLPPGLEVGLLGRVAGEHYTQRLENAYGLWDEHLLVEAKREDFPSNAEMHIGAIFFAQDEAGKPVSGRIVGVDKNHIRIDLNHEHAGKTLELEVLVHGVRPADPEELAHGHVHGAGGVLHDHP